MDESASSNVSTGSFALNVADRYTLSSFSSRVSIGSFDLAIWTRCSLSTFSSCVLVGSFDLAVQTRCSLSTSDDLTIEQQVLGDNTEQSAEEDSGAHAKASSKLMFGTVSEQVFYNKDLSIKFEI